VIAQQFAGDSSLQVTLRCQLSRVVPAGRVDATAVIYLFNMDYQQRITVGGASCACVSQRDSIELHNEPHPLRALPGGRMEEPCLLYLLCMLPFPVLLTFCN
jgi:hypothetical protein